jgi:hypothetical protein
LPDPDFSSDLRELNSKMESLRSNFPTPEEIDNVDPTNARPQTNIINTAIHTMTSDYLKKDYHPELIANVLFNKWLRLAVFFGLPERQWQKMDYYLPEILAVVRKHLATIRSAV